MTHTDGWNADDRREKPEMKKSMNKHSHLGRGHRRCCGMGLQGQIEAPTSDQCLYVCCLYGLALKCVIAIRLYIEHQHLVVSPLLRWPCLLCFQYTYMYMGIFFNTKLPHFIAISYSMYPLFKASRYRNICTNRANKCGEMGCCWGFSIGKHHRSPVC